MILIFGIIGLVACVIFAPVAWIMGNADMKEIRAGTMDPEGESLTNIGRILGIIGTVLFLLGMCAWIPLMILMVAAGGA